MMAPYYLLFKTGDAEIRALSHCNVLDNIIPLVELTKSRRSTKDKQGNIEKRLKSIAEIFKGKPIILDITTDERQSNEQTQSFYDYEDGYLNWINFVQELKSKEEFKQLIPCILANTSDPYFDDNFSKQVKALNKFFPTLAYRSPINDDGYLSDLQIISTLLEDKYTIKVIIDCLDIKYTSFSSNELIAEINERIESIKTNCKNLNVEIIIAGTSFPNSVSDYVKDDSSADFPVEEINLFNSINASEHVFYGDYGSVNPIRNDDIKMTRGWIPRIDLTTSTDDGGLTIHFERERRFDTEAKINRDYADAYTSVAKKMLRIPSFPRNLQKNWGIEQIELCANGKAPGASPSFWISVRMSIFIHQQVLRLMTKQSP